MEAPSNLTIGEAVFVYQGTDRWLRHPLMAHGVVEHVYRVVVGKCAGHFVRFTEAPPGEKRTTFRLEGVGMVCIPD